jgi:hypothetical protein
MLLIETVAALEPHAWPLFWKIALIESRASFVRSSGALGLRPLPKH